MLIPLKTTISKTSRRSQTDLWRHWGPKQGTCCDQPWGFQPGAMSFFKIGPALGAISCIFVGKNGAWREAQIHYMNILCTWFTWLLDTYMWNIYVEYPLYVEYPQFFWWVHGLWRLWSTCRIPGAPGCFEGAAACGACGTPGTQHGRCHETKEDLRRIWTMGVWYKLDLIGGFKHFLFSIMIIWDNPSHWQIFFKMVKTTNQRLSDRPTWCEKPHHLPYVKSTLAHLGVIHPAVNTIPGLTLRNIGQLPLAKCWKLCCWALLWAFP